MNQKDEKYLERLALQVFAVLDTQDLRSPFRVHPTGGAYKLNSDGWAVKLGNFRGFQSSVELWLGKFTAHEDRKLYYCVHSEKPEGIKKLVQLLKPYLGNHISIFSSHWTSHEKPIQLHKRMLKKDFGRPIFERYPKYKEYIYGIYVFERVGLQKNETRRLVTRIVDFIVTINSALSKDQLRQDAEEYQGNENHKAVQLHLRRERRSHLATLRKQYDNFICQVCGFDYTSTYGTLGDDFAEAHHIVPLSVNDKQRITNIDDLITVCANCHRMLHRMDGEAGDVAKLKKIVKQRKG